MLERTAPDGRLVGLDRDPDASAIAGERLARFGARVTLAHASFRELARVLGELGVPRVDGLLLDLGMSSRQLDAAERGFRFAEAEASQAPLDMRMDPTRGPTAADLLARASDDELAAGFAGTASCRGPAGSPARWCAPPRAAAPRRGGPLAAVRAAGVGRGRRHNPATLVFQALRIAVNDELAALERGLDAGLDALRPGGRVCVIAYHSLEDRIVKQRFQREERGCTPACLRAPCAPAAASRGCAARRARRCARARRRWRRTPARAPPGCAPPRCSRRPRERRYVRGLAAPRSRAPARARARIALPWLPLILGLFVGGVALVALRGAIVRARYELGSALQREARLLELDRAAAVSVRRLRDPRRLRELAVERGFVVPERVIELPARPAPRRAP